MDEPILLRVADVARLLSLSRSAVYELIAAGQLPHIRLGSSLRVPRAALERWIQDRTIEPTLPARPPHDRPAAAPDETVELWVDAHRQGSSAAAASGDKGPDKGPDAPRLPTKRPDLSSDRAEEGEIGTAYRIRTGDLRLERAVS